MAAPVKAAEQIAWLFRALGVQTRVRIVQLLRDGALCVGALSARLGVSQSAVSQHLRVLRDAGLVLAERRGYFVHYHLNAQAIAECREVAEQLLGGLPDGEKTCLFQKEKEPCAPKRGNARNPRT